MYMNGQQVCVCECVRTKCIIYNIVRNLRSRKIVNNWQNKQINEVKKRQDANKPKKQATHKSRHKPKQANKPTTKQQGYIWTCQFNA